MDKEQARHEKRVGTVVEGRWRLDELLGWGSTAAVYAATHRNGHRAALKILHRSLCADAAACDRFLREARIANAIKHRSVVPVGDDGITEDGCAYLVLELLEGETLEAKRQRTNGKMSLEELAPIADELMSAIAAVHAAGVVHRDLKPQNVFLAKNGLKLLDFGTARIFDPTLGSGLSVQGLVVGTPAFMSPEQARGARDEIDAQSDVWSVGAMLFTVLSGEYVHVGRDAHARLLAAASRPARSLVDVAPSIDARVVDVIDRALAYVKTDRWSDVQSMRVAFRTAVMAAVPTMPEMKAFDVTCEEETTPGTRSVSEPIVASLATSTEPVSVEAESTPAVSTDAESDSLPAMETGPAVARFPTSFPISGKVIGGLAVAASFALVAFAAALLDEPRSAATSAAAAVAPAPAEPEPTPIVAAAPSYMVITAPDLPTPETQPGVAPRAVAAVAAAKPSSPSSTSVGPPAAQAEATAVPEVAPDASAGGIVRTMDEEPEPAPASPLSAAEPAPAPDVERP